MSAVVGGMLCKSDKPSIIIIIIMSPLAKALARLFTKLLLLQLCRPHVKNIVSSPFMGNTTHVDWRWLGLASSGWAVCTHMGSGMDLACFSGVPPVFDQAKGPPCFRPGQGAPLFLFSTRPGGPPAFDQARGPPVFRPGGPGFQLPF